jgi:hypothetical protein
LLTLDVMVAEKRKVCLRGWALLPHTLTIVSRAFSKSELSSLSPSSMIKNLVPTRLKPLVFSR